MTYLDEMWVELKKYQTYAEKHGFGAEWKQMCEERTERAAAMAAARAAWTAARAAAWAVRAAIASRHATENIRKAIKLEEKT